MVRKPVNFLQIQPTDLHDTTLDSNIILTLYRCNLLIGMFMLLWQCKINVILRCWHNVTKQPLAHGYKTVFQLTNQNTTIIQWLILVVLLLGRYLIFGITVFVVGESM